MPAFRLLLFLAVLLLPTMAAADDHATPDSLTRVSGVQISDLEQIIKDQHPIRVLVSYNRTNFFLVNGAMRGMEHDLMQAYKQFLQKKDKKRTIRMVFVTVPFDRIIPELKAGRGDIAAAGLTITKARKKQVPFSTPYRTGVNEIIIGSPKAQTIKTIDDIAGETVYVMAGASYADHLLDLNMELSKKGLKQVIVKIADKNLVTEDLLEMAERGIIDYTVADSHLAAIWKTALPRLQLFNEAPLRTGGELGWGIRPNSPQLLKSVNEFAKTVRGGTLMGNMVFKRYFVNSDWVKNPNARVNRKKMDKLMALFQKYGKQYAIDWLKLGALAYQESGLNMETRSSRGAVGIMQVMPKTATSKAVNVANYKTLDGNIHAGSKYLRHLMDNYFIDVDKSARVDFALAAYNAGPNRVRQLRKTAEEMGLDPNLWFGNVEYAAARKIGTETPTYVANVQMYYAAYKSIYNVLSERQSVE